MIIEPIIGIQKRNTTISEKEFPSFSIFSTAQMLRNYFVQYGYQFAGFYDDEKELIVVKDNNVDVSMLTENYNNYQVIDYRTGKIELKGLSIGEAASKFFSRKSSKIFSFTHEIEEIDEGMRLVHKATSTTVLEAESMMFLDPDKILVNNYGLEIIFCISEGVGYPLIKQDQHVYMGKSPESFVDMRFGMFVTYQNWIQPLHASFTDLFETVKKYPYGEKIQNKFKLLNLPIRYGIFYQNGDITQTNWYKSQEERDAVLDELGLLVKDVLVGNYVKIKKD